MYIQIHKALINLAQVSLVIKDAENKATLNFYYGKDLFHTCTLENESKADLVLKDVATLMAGGTTSFYSFDR